MNINPRTPEAYRLLHDGTLALSRAEQQGLRIDMNYIEEQKEFVTKKIAQIEQEFKETDFYANWEKSSKTSININSSTQLEKYLYEVLGLRIDKETKTGKGSTDDEALKQLNIPELNDLLKAKKLKKVRDTYLDGIGRETVNGILHPFFDLGQAVTFRSSSNSPNFQNLPIRDEESMNIVRGAIKPRPGHLLMEADFSGIEVRVNACLNRDKNLIKYIEDPASDMHADMATQLFSLGKFNKAIAGHSTLRQAAKNAFVFPEFYGSYYKNCAKGLACSWGKLQKGYWKAGQGIVLGDKHLSDYLISQGIKSFDAMTEHVRLIEEDFWGKRFVEYAKWKDKWWEQYQKTGYIDMPTGFRCNGLMDKKQVCNYPGQGSAFHCLLWSLINVDRVMVEEEWDTRIVGQIHDSILFDTLPEEKDYVKEVVNDILTQQLPKAFSFICVPMEIEIEEYEIDGPWVKTKNN